MVKSNIRTKSKVGIRGGSREIRNLPDGGFLVIDYPVMPEIRRIETVIERCCACDGKGWYWGIDQGKARMTHCVICQATGQIKGKVTVFR